MRIGIFADSHDHLDNIRRAVDVFNENGCELVVFAGDLVSTIAIPPLRALRCPLVGCFGDNEGNRIGIRGGMRIIGPLAEPPFGFRAPDGTRIVVTHQRELLRGQIEGCEVAIFGHTHRASIQKDCAGRLIVNPGETSGWIFGQPSVTILETQPLQAKLVLLQNDTKTHGEDVLLLSDR
ncbi:YfcE family phosphodiesterase [Bythopirellula goksoeyrii]|uniref:Phosphoesterase n=1 Tax=Bythopirellula goksoeyrii TaxID=1400387 RepID=A0A5B9Q9Z6_9BACT|nr:YfcE family phosphodiesterase [Bythopirellula goksoeyrii]QEG35797.1 phosphodiesterase [Bythopirellula goksoeyrii]